MKNLFLATLVFGMATAMLSGCNLNNDWEEKEKDEISTLEKHITDLKAQGAVIEDKEIASYTMYFENLGDFATPGISPVGNDYIIIDYVRRELSGEIIYTNYDSLMSSWTLFNSNKDSYSHYLFVPVKIIFGYNTVGFNAGVSLMHEGQKARFYMPSGLAFHDHVSIIDEVKLYKVIPDIVSYDSTQVEWFASTNGLDESTYIAADNIFYKEIAPGDTTIDIAATDSLEIKFVAYYLQEESLIKFDSIWGTSDQDYVVIPSTRSKVEGFIPDGYAPLTKGFAATMDTVAIGTEALLVVPYTKGYGTGGLRQATLNYTVVPDYTSLVYRFKVIGKK